MRLRNAAILCTLPLAACFVRNDALVEAFDGSSIVVSSPYLSPQNQSTPVLITILSENTPAAGGFVTLTSDDPQAVFVQPVGPTDINGQTTAKFTTTHPGTWRITAKASFGGNQVSTLPQTALVTYTAGSTSPTADALALRVTPNSIAAGSQAALSVLATNLFGTGIAGYSSTLALHSSDANVVLPQPVVGVADAAGSIALGNVTFNDAGLITLSVAASDGLTAQTTIAVQAGNAATFSIDPMATATVGQATQLNLRAFDAHGNPATSYSGNLTVTCSDATAFASSAVFAPNAQGTLQLVGTFTQPGAQTVTIADPTHPGLTATTSVFVDAATPYFTVTPTESSVQAGTPQSFNLTAYNVDTTINTSYAGTVTFSSSDPNATLPGTFTFGAAMQGLATVPGFTLVTAGQQTVTATDPVTTAQGTSSAVTVIAAGVIHLQLTNIPSTVTAGGNVTATVIALDAYGNHAASYTGTVHMQSDDGAAVMPTDVALTTANQGVVTRTFNLRTQGNHQVTAIDINNGALQATVSPILVQAASASRLMVSGFPSPATAGVAAQATVTAYDPYGNVATGFRDGVILSSSDTQAALPAAHSFTVSNAGIATFSLSLRTVGTQSINANDVAQPSIAGQQSGIVVKAAGAASLSIRTTSTTATAGTPLGVVVQALDAFGNTVPSYTGTAHFASTDTSAILPTDYAFVTADAGAHSFTNALTLVTSGNQTLNANDVSTPSIAGVSPVVSVGAAGTSHLGVQLPAIVTAGAAAQAVISARDPYHNVAKNYLGTVTFTLTDAQAVFPATATFTAANAGIMTFSSAVFKTAGTQKLTAQDTVTAAWNGNTTTNVAPSTATSLALTGVPGTVANGQVFNVTVTAHDAYNNVASGYSGTVSGTSTDGAATLPGAHTFISTDAGITTMAFALRTLGTQNITLSDSAHGLSVNQNGIIVNASTASNLKVTGITSGQAGAASNAVVTALDSTNAVLTTYTGVVHATSTDAGASLPANYSFTTGDQGVHTFTGAITFVTAGNQNVTFTDINTSAFGTQTGIAITASSPTRYALSGLAANNAGTAQTLTVSVVDTYGNIVQTYTNSLHLTSTDSQATLPGDFTFQLTDAGVHSFAGGVTLATVGNQTVTATSTSGTAINGNITANVTPAAANHFTIAGVAGGTSPVTSSPVVTVLDVYNNVVPGYRGTVQWTSTDPRAAVPANYKFLATDNGIHTFTSGVTLRVQGNQTVTATDTVTSSVTGTSAAASVVAGAVTKLGLAGINDAAAGTAQNLVVTAFDAFGNTNAGYVGRVTFSSTDPQGAVPSLYSFTAANAGVASFTAGVTLRTAGNQNVIGMDAANSSIVGVANANVTTSAASQLVLTGLTSSTAGNAQTVVVTVEDAFTNVVKGYLGTVSFSSTDPNATLPGLYTFTSADSGVHTFSFGVVLATVGTRSVKAQDTVTSTINGTQAGLVVSAGSATNLQVTAAAGGTSPVTSSPVVTALDAYGNTATGYAAKVTWTSTDTLASLPPNYSFVAATDKGVHTFTNGVTLRRAGTQSITATDTATATINGSQGALIVNPGAATHLSVTNLVGGTAIATSSPTVTALDVSGNTATGYTGTITFTSTDPQATLPSNYSFATSVAGVHSFTSGVGLKTAGNQNIVAKDLASPGISGVSNTVSVTAGALAQFVLGGLHGGTAPVTATLQLSATDAYGNVLPNYLGKVLFSSSDAQATIPALYSFTAVDAGVHTFANGVILKTAGTQTFSATDTASSVTSSVGSLVITAGSMTGYALSGATVTAAGAPYTLKVTAVDGYNNVIQAYLGRASFSSTDPSAQLPAAYSFTSADQGLHTFSSAVTFATNGAVTLQANDVTTPALSGSIGVQVTSNNPAGMTGQAWGGCVIVSGGNVKCWGDNLSGNLGYGDTINRGTSSTQMGANLPLVNLGAGRTALSVSTGGDTVGSDGLFACAVLDNGAVKCWGYNADGELGIGTTANASTPPSATVTFIGGQTALSVSTGGQHVCALLSDYNVTCWGLNGDGQLGMGDAAMRKAPTGTVNLGTGRTATQLATGSYHTCALLDNQNITCWGANADGELGYGDRTARKAPLTNGVYANTSGPLKFPARAISAGGYATCATHTNGINAYCWGNNDGGQQGVGNTNEQDSPSQITFAGSPAVHNLSMGYLHACAAIGNGNITCWGKNNAGQLGLGDTATRTSPPTGLIQLPTGRTATAISAGYNFTCAQLDNQTLTCFGVNAQGQLGMGVSGNLGDTSATTPNLNGTVQY